MLYSRWNHVVIPLLYFHSQVSPFFPVLGPYLFWAKIKKQVTLYNASASLDYRSIVRIKNNDYDCKYGHSKARNDLFFFKNETKKVNFLYFK